MAFIVPQEIETYAEQHTTEPAPHLKAVAQQATSLGWKQRMLTGALEGRLLKTLVAIQQPRLVLEIGCFTGYSALSMAEALPDGARIITCELDAEHANLAQANFDNSPHASKIDLRRGPALDTINSLDGPFDLVFIDADKTNYANYFDAVLPKLALNGTIAVDNVLWSGSVLDDTDETDDRKAIVAFNQKVKDDDRVEQVMLTVRDGITLIRRV